MDRPCAVARGVDTITDGGEPEWLAGGRFSVGDCLELQSPAGAPPPFNFGGVSSDGGCVDSTSPSGATPSAPAQ
jgi:hypothetical protein